MATANLGRVGFVTQGDWSAGTYEYLDVVKHTGGSYVCSTTSTTEEPSDVAVDWQPIALDSTAELIDDPSPQLSSFLDTNGNMIQFSKGADVASATALPILKDGNYFDVTGTTTITSINTTGKVGTFIKLHFDAALTLTHHATDLILPTGSNITTAAGDEAEFIEYATGDFICTTYTKADGTPLAINIVDDATPQLGGNLDLNGNAIVDPKFTGLITEQVSVSTLTLGATSSVQTYTATADFTIVDDLVSGESVTLILTSAGFTPTWPTITWWDSADGTTEPTLGTTDKIKFEKIGSTLYGTHTGAIV